jgi:hypothetical protein
VHRKLVRRSRDGYDTAMLELGAWGINIGAEGRDSDQRPPNQSVLETSKRGFSRRFLREAKTILIRAYKYVCEVMPMESFLRALKVCSLSAAEMSMISD